MKKIVVISLVVCLGISLLFSAALAQSDDDIVVVHPYYWDPSTPIYSNQTIVLGMGWAACRKGAVQMFLTAVQQYWSIDGVPVFSSDEDPNQYWGEIGERSYDPVNSACMGKPPDHIWGTSWRYTLGTLEPGEYEIFFDWWLDHPVTDIADYDGDGRPDIIYELGDNTITITVVDQ